MKGKMLMFAKTSFLGFVYDMIDVFMYPDEVVQTVYTNYQIKKCKSYQNLTDTDSTSPTLIFICDHDHKISEKDSRKIIFDVLVVSKVINRLDLSDDFWALFGVQNKKVGLYEIDSIDYPNILTVSIYPKEYFEKYRDKTSNKKRKGLKKDTHGMDIDAYLSRLSSLDEYCDKQKQKKITLNMFQFLLCC